MAFMCSEMEENNVCRKPEDDLDPDRLGLVDDDTIFLTLTDVPASGNMSFGWASRIDTERGEIDSVHDRDGSTENSRNVRKGWIGKKYDPKPAVIKSVHDPAPSLEELATVGQGKVARHINGTLKNPRLVHKVLPKSLFIDGKVDSMDVRQNNIGDCYLLAAILQVIHYDGNHIIDMMRVMGDEVYTELYHREGDANTGYHWVRKPVSVKWGLECMNYKDEDGDYTTEVVGAGYRVKYEPENDARWSANFEQDTLMISKTSYYQAAMWVHCLEQAYQVYARKYGQFGTGKGIKGENRIKGIEGGWSGYCLNMIYGDDVVSHENTDTRHDIPLKYERTIAEQDSLSMVDGSENLLSKLAGLARTQDGSGKYDTHISVSTTDDDICPRIQYYSNTLISQVEEEIKRYQNDPKYGRAFADGHERARYIRHLNRSIKTLRQIDQDAGLYMRQPEVVGREWEKTPEQEAVAGKLDLHQRELIQNKEFQMLGLKDYVSLRSLLASLAEGTGSNIYMYTNHAYNVREIHLVDKKGNNIDIDKLYVSYYHGKKDPGYGMENGEKIKRDGFETVQGEIASRLLHLISDGEQKLDIESLKTMVDLDASEVVIENPHGEGKAVYPGQKETKLGSGTWTTSLRELLANTSTFTAVMVRNHRHDKRKAKKS